MRLNNFSEVIQPLNFSINEAGTSVVSLSRKMADNWERKATASRWLSQCPPILNEVTQNTFVRGTCNEQ